MISKSVISCFFRTISGLFWVLSFVIYILHISTFHFVLYLVGVSNSVCFRLLAWTFTADQHGQILRCILLSTTKVCVFYLCFIFSVQNNPKFIYFCFLFIVIVLYIIPWSVQKSMKSYIIRMLKWEWVRILILSCVCSCTPVSYVLQTDCEFSGNCF